MKKKIKFSSLALVIIIIIIVNINIPHANDIKCKTYIEDLNWTFKGKVIRKYQDYKNHNYPLIIIQNKNYIDTINLVRDGSGLFDYILNNDSIKKIKGSYEVQIFRDDIDTTFILDYDCKFENYEQ